MLCGPSVRGFVVVAGVVLSVVVVVALPAGVAAIKSSAGVCRIKFQPGGLERSAWLSLFCHNLEGNSNA